jgi:hypothetical protein
VVVDILIQFGLVLPLAASTFHSAVLVMLLPVSSTAWKLALSAVALSPKRLSAPYTWILVGVGVGLTIDNIIFLVPLVNPFLVHVIINLYVPIVALVVHTNCPLVVVDILIQSGLVLPLAASTFHSLVLVMLLPVSSIA